MTLMTFVGSLIHGCGANLGRVAIGGMSILSVWIAADSVPSLTAQANMATLGLILLCMFTVYLFILFVFL